MLVRCRMERWQLGLPAVTATCLEVSLGVLRLHDDPAC